MKIMFTLIKMVITKLIPSLDTEENRVKRDFERMLLPNISSTPNYSVAELEEISYQVEQFNDSTLQSALWSPDLGRLEFISNDGIKFWFVTSSNSSQNLAALASFTGSHFRAHAERDGRVKLTGWCEHWHYSIVAETLRISNQ